MAAFDLKSSLEDLPPRSALYPITPRQTSFARYEAPKRRSQMENRLIRAGSYSYAGEPQTPALPSGWSAHLNPEGSVYFVCQSDLAIVTDVYMYTPSVQVKVAKFAALAKKIIKTENISLSDSVELFLRPDEEQDTCVYFLVDHASHVVLWLEDVDSADLGLNDTVSDSHMRWMLESQYWAGLEMFPSHRIERLNLNVDELIGIFDQGEADRRTSKTSTVSFTADQCLHYARLLRQARDSSMRSHSVWFIARMWEQICGSRMWHHYGQERARLDYTQKILGDPEDDEPKKGFIFSTLSYALCGYPAAYLRLIDRESTDDIYNFRRWYSFVDQTKNEWAQCLTWSLCVSIIDLLSLLVPGTSGILAGLSLFCCAGVVLAAFALLQRHTTAHPADRDPESCTFLTESSQDGHRRAAISFALPRGLFLWAVGLAAGQGLVWFERNTSAYVLGSLAILVVLVCLPWRRWGARIASALPRCRRTLKDEYDIVEKAA